MDPLAEKYPGLSPYNYTANNPVMLVDPDGKVPILPLIFKAGANAAADWLLQTAMNYFFNPATAGDLEKSMMDVNGWQVFRSGLEGLIPWKTPGGRLGRAALTATGDVMANWLDQGSDYTTVQALEDFMVGFIGDLAGGGLGELLSKYGPKPVAKGLARLPGFNALQIRKLTGYDIIKSYADEVAKKIGGKVVKADGDGWKIIKGKYNIRIMYKSKTRSSPYIRISYARQGSIDASESFNSDPAATHIDFSGDPTEKIIDIINKNEKIRKR